MVQWLESGRMGRPRGGGYLEESLKGQHWTCPNACSNSWTYARPSLASGFQRRIGGRQKEHEDREAVFIILGRGSAGSPSGPDGQKAGRGLANVCSAVLLGDMVEGEDTWDLQSPVARDDPGSRRLYTQDLGSFKAEPIIS